MAHGLGAAAAAATQWADAQMLASTREMANSELVAVLPPRPPAPEPLLQPEKMSAKSETTNEELVAVLPPPPPPRVATPTGKDGPGSIPSLSYELARTRSPT